MVKSTDAPSYYTATATTAPKHNRLEGEVAADVCIVGAGYTGLSAAIELAAAGYRTVVLEAETVGYGASGRNGGQVCTGFSSSQAKIEAQLGKADAAKAFAMAEESKALLTDRIARHRIDCDLRWGYLHTRMSSKPGRRNSTASASPARASSARRNSKRSSVPESIMVPCASRARATFTP